MNDKKKTVKDSYGRLIENKSFDEYWDEFHKIENLSMKESIPVSYTHLRAHET